MSCKDNQAVCAHAHPYKPNVRAFVPLLFLSDACSILRIATRVRKHPVRIAGSVGQAARAAAAVRQFQGSRSAMRLAG